MFSQHALFHDVPAGATETIYDDQIQSFCERAELGKYLGIENIRDNFKDFSSHYTRTRFEREGVRHTNALERSNHPRNIFAALDGAIEIALQSNKSKAIKLIKLITKKNV